jgi:ribosome biogenesis GTPase / thiamine phosphate phosphatase
MTFDLSSLGWDDDFAVAYDRFRRSDHEPGRVTRVDRGVCSVLTASGLGRASVGGGLLAATAADPVRFPCAGDWGVLRTWPDDRVTIEATLPRRTALVRAGAGKDATGQILAANVDSVAVVAAADPEPDLGRIERLLALAWESDAQPLVILTKVDLVRDPRAIAEDVGAIAPGVTVYPVSAVRSTGLKALRPHLAPGRTLGLMGISGAGKSTLVNVLAGAPVMGVREIRSDGRGRHTTTYRALVPLPGGGAVIDTPGIRAVGLFDGVAGLERAFADVDLLARGCRFPDCTHGDEPDCAVTAALATGELNGRRLESWRRLHREIAYESRRSDARAAAEERRRWKRAYARSRPDRR